MIVLKTMIRHKTKTPLLRWGFLSFLVLSLFSILTCCSAREPGPLENEYGKVFYWHLYNLDTVVTKDCNQELSERFKKYDIEANEYLNYQLTNDGQSAIALVCTSFNSKKCKKRLVDLSGDGNFDDPIVMPIKNHELSYDFPDRISFSELFDCEHHSQTSWRMVDKGDTLEWKFQLSHRFEGDPQECNYFKEQIDLEIGEEKNIENCKVTQTFDAELHSIVESQQ